MAALANQEQSQTFGPLRAPSLGERESLSAWNNPLLWRLGRYRRIGPLRLSRAVVEHFLFGFFLAGLMIALATALPGMFALHDFNLMASVAIGTHILWMSSKMSKRMAYWQRSAFLDELALTEMTPREIAGAIAQSVSRPLLAGVLGVLAPLYAMCAAGALGESREQRFCLLAWGILAPFVVLGMFAVPWLCIRQALLPPGRCRETRALILLWALALPLGAVLGNALSTAIVAGALLFATLGLALHVGPQVPGMLANRDV